MKLALLSPAAERQERRDRLRRDRAAALALREVFPAVQQLRLELLFQGSTSTTPGPQSHILHAPGWSRENPETAAPAARSEEHTSELQSRVHLVSRLLVG